MLNHRLFAFLGTIFGHIIPFYVTSLLKIRLHHYHQLLTCFHAALNFGRCVHLALSRKMLKQSISRLPEIKTGPDKSPKWKDGWH